jgi:starch synthase
MAPLVKLGGLGDVVGSLPAALREVGVDARIVLPAYPGMFERLEAQNLPPGKVCMSPLTGVCTALLCGRHR